jgi:hypothetical protein
VPGPNENVRWWTSFWFWREASKDVAMQTAPASVNVSGEYVNNQQA